MINLLTSPIEDIAAFLPGKRIKIIGTVSSHTYGPVNSIMLVNSVLVFNSANRQLKFNTSNSYIVTGEFVLTDKTTEQIKEELAICKEQIKLLASQIDYMEQTKTEFFVELEFKVWSALQQARKEGLNPLDITKAVIEAMR